MNNITNPISSNQVTEVAVRKPACMDNCGNTLNDWLKWLAEKQCEVNWSLVDTTCLDNFFGADCKKDLKSIIEKMIQAICTLQQITVAPDCPGCGSGSGDCCTIVEEVLVLEERWNNVDAGNPARATLINGFVELSGRINGGSTLNPIIVLPNVFRPSFARRVPFAFAFALPNVSNEHPFMNIGIDGNVQIVWSGVSPGSTLNGDIFLDGIRFKL
jgi:hypothetical protein